MLELFGCGFNLFGEFFLRLARFFEFAFFLPIEFVFGEHIAGEFFEAHVEFSPALLYGFHLVDAFALCFVRFPMDFKQAGPANGKGGCFPIRGPGVVVVSADSVGDLIAGEQVEVGHVPGVRGLDFAPGRCDNWQDVICVVAFLVSELQARDAIVVKASATRETRIDSVRSMSWPGCNRRTSGG